MHHPADQSIGFALRQLPRIVRYPAIGNGCVQERAYLAVKLGFQRRNKIRKPRT
jgi:hypothetical protein